MAISKFQQQVLEEAFGQVLDRFKGRTIDKDGQLQREVQEELRKKLGEIAAHEPVFESFTVTVTVDQLQTDRFVFDVHPRDGSGIAVSARPEPQPSPRRASN